MSDESIQVVYKPVAANGWHETLVYTARDGHQEYASAYASNTSPAGNSMRDLGDAASGASHNHRGGGSPYGTLETESDRLPQANSPIIFGPPGARLPTETVAQGQDLSRKWSEVREAYREVGQAHFTYSPLTQNSNSAASTAMVAASIRPPQDNGLTSRHWTPAADNILPIPAVEHRSGAKAAPVAGSPAFGALASSPEASRLADAHADAQVLWRRSAGIAAGGAGAPSVARDVAAHPSDASEVADAHRSPTLRA